MQLTESERERAAAAEVHQHKMVRFIAILQLLHHHLHLNSMLL